MVDRFLNNVKLKQDYIKMYSDYDVDENFFNESSNNYFQNSNLLKQLNLLTKGSGTGFFLYDIHNNDSFYSENLNKYFDQLNKKLTYKTIIKELIYQEDQKQFKRAIRKVVKRNELQSTELRLRFIDKLVWIKLELSSLNLPQTK